MPRRGDSITPHLRAALRDQSVTPARRMVLRRATPPDDMRHSTGSTPPSLSVGSGSRAASTRSVEGATPAAPLVQVAGLRAPRATRRRGPSPWRASMSPLAEATARRRRSPRARSTAGAALVRPGATGRLSPTGARMRNPRTRDDPLRHVAGLALIPAELVQPLVVDPKVMCDLMHHGDGDLVSHLVDRVTYGERGVAIDEDAIGKFTETPVAPPIRE